MRWRNGSRRCARWVENIPEVTLYKPAGVPLRNMEIVEISLVEIEAVRLTDLEGLTQEEAARRMGISRRSFWNDLMTARKKIAYALSQGCAIQIVDGNVRFSKGKNNENEEE